MDDNDELLPGAFGDATRLSAKALRVYADQGLLTPARIDARTGYRHYRHDQIPRARLIADLRALDLPLARVAELLDTDAATRATRLHEWLDAAQARLHRQRAAVNALGRRGAGDPALADAIRVHPIPPRRVLYRQLRVRVDLMDDAIAESARRIRAHLEAEGIPDDGRILVFFHGMVTLDSDGPIEIAVTAPRPVEPVDDLRVRIVPAHRAARLSVEPRHRDHPEVLAYYDALDAWLEARPDARLIDAVYETHPGGTRLDINYPLSPDLTASP
ncbi:MerR family transcriptional regulator [Stackebrandtia soli]|uniref:MerR family transcriptional regulator n=1 Tax=Stackebrandtia soli TaxID=1892856 RepID=UPI0039E80FC4